MAQSWRDVVARGMQTDIARGGRFTPALKNFGGLVNTAMQLGAKKKMAKFESELPLTKAKTKYYKSKAKPGLYEHSVDLKREMAVAKELAKAALSSGESIPIDTRVEPNLEQIKKYLPAARQYLRTGSLPEVESEITTGGLGGWEDEGKEGEGAIEEESQEDLGRTGALGISAGDFQYISNDNIKIGKLYRLDDGSVGVAVGRDENGEPVYQRIQPPQR